MIHALPRFGVEGRTPCCRAHLGDLPPDDLVTNRPEEVTCHRFGGSAANRPGDL